jgi:hypothetical protein
MLARLKTGDLACAVHQDKPDSEQTGSSSGPPSLLCEGWRQVPARIRWLEPLNTRIELGQLYLLGNRVHRASNAKLLGPVGGRIVAGTFAGLLTYDSQSFLNEDPTWKPMFGKDGGFGLKEFVSFALGR